MEILDLRHFASADLRPLLEDEIAVWGRLLSWDYATSAEMILRYMDAKILPGYAAIERGSIFGYSFFVYEQSKGVIGDLFVREYVREYVRNGARDAVREGGRNSGRHEVEERLLTHVIETLQQSPGIHRVEAQLLTHHTGEVSQPFLQQGFSRHPRVFMNFDIGKHPQASLKTLPPLPPQFEIRRVVGAGIPVGSGADHRRLPRPRRFRDQRSVPHAHRLAALSEQHCALPGVRDFRSSGLVCRRRSPYAHADRPHPVLAGAPRCRPHHAGVRAPRIPLRRPRRSHAGRVNQEFARARIPFHLADGDGGE